MNNTIKHLPNGDFEVVKQIKEIEANIKDIKCPIILFEVNRKYRELNDKLNES